MLISHHSFLVNSSHSSGKKLREIEREKNDSGVHLTFFAVVINALSK